MFVLADYSVVLEQITSAMSAWVWATPLFILLLGCGLIFTVVTKFTQWRILTHGYACIRGHYDKPGDTGHINHFQALCAALSATIGLGNIAGVALAVSVGGPGAVFWMWVVGLFGMSLKFMECTLAVMFRDVRDVPDPSAPDLVRKDAEQRTLEYEGEAPPEPGARPVARGEVRGGPMWYMQKGLVDKLRERGNGLWVVFKVLAILFAVATMLNSFGGGNMFQGWNVADTLNQNFHIPPLLSAVVVAALVALVIIGGIKRIGTVAAKLVPFMCVVYVLGALVVIVLHVTEIPFYIGLIVKHAFTPMAETGGFIGVTFWLAFRHGMVRACFSNEAGEGSAAMAHAAARTEEPIREGVVAGIGPFVDTLVICTMSALVLLMSGAWNRPVIGTVQELRTAMVNTEQGETNEVVEQIVVECNSDLPDKFRRQYFDAITASDGLGLAVLVEREQGKEPRTFTCPVAQIDGDQEAGWTGVRAITLDAAKSESPETERDKLAVGQPVHLDISGAKLTGFAFDLTLPGFGKYMVTLAVCLFAFSTMISWSYYGEKGAEYLLGPRAILPYKFVFVIFVIFGMMMPKFQYVYNFSDATTGLMVLCNLPAVLILSPYVLRAGRDYFRRLDGGQMPHLR
ncbi:MAG: amino acid carrier protein [Planctomycetota bacterium]